MAKILIIGAGMAGIGAAHYLDKNDFKATIFEEKKYYGGNAASFNKKEEFIFDNVPHFFFSKDPRILNLLYKSANEKVRTIKPQINNYWKGHWIKHPIQVNLHGLPKDLILNILKEIHHIDPNNEKLANNFKEWLNAILGETFTQNFPVKFSIKYHTISAEKIELSDVKQKFYSPTFNEVLAGAFSRKTKDVQYTEQAYYPSSGGFVSFLDNIASKINIELEHKIISIHTKKKTVLFENGRIERYDQLISTMPLPELINVISGVPLNVRLAAKELAYTNCIIINIGVDRKNISKNHCTYFYDSNIIFSKLTFPRLFSPNNVPKGCDSIQAEIYFSEKYKPLHLLPDNFIDPTIISLRRSGIISSNDKIIYSEAKLIPYANIIYDFDRKPSLSVVKKFLDEKDIKYCGRYGNWENLMAEESFISGENAAKKVIKQLFDNTISEDSSNKNYWFVEN